MYSNTRPPIPNGLRDLVKDLTREILKEKPNDMYSFAENYFQSLLSEKENYEVKGFELSNQKYNVVQSQCTQRFQIATIMAHSIVPENLTDLIKEFTKTTLRAQPQNLCEFAVEYFRQLRKSKKIVNSKDISYIEFDSYFKNKDRFLFTPFVRCLCGRTIGEGFNTNSRLDYVTSKREINNDIETKNVAYSSYITKSNECNENNNNTKPENELSEEYMNSIYLIQRFIRRYLTHKNLKLKSKKPQLPKTIMSEEQAALIIQRSLRKLFGCTNTSRPFETTDNLPVVPQLQLNHYENDSISEAASYTSASTAVLSASESSREVPEFSPAENIVKETIVEGEELENDNQNVIKCEHVNDSTCLECFQKGGFAKYSGRNIPVSGEENVAHDSQSDKEACSSRDLLDNEGNGTEIPFPFQEKEHSAPLSRTQENIDSMRTIAEMDEELVSSANIETEQKQNKDLHHIRQETTYGSNIEYNEVDNSSIENNTDTIAGQDGALISPENYENEQKKVTAEVNKDIHHIRQQTVYGSNVDFISEEEKNKTIDYEDCTFYEVEESSAHNKADTLPEKDRALISTKNHESEQNNVISEVNKDEFSRGEENNNNTVDKDCTFSEIEGTSMQNNGSSLPKKDGALTSPAKVIADVNKDKHHFQQNNADGSDTEFTIGKENNKIIVGMDCNLNEVEDSLIKNNALTEKNGALISPINHNHAQKKVIAEVNEDTQHIREKIGDGSNVEIRCGEENNKNIVDKDSTFNEVEDSSIRNNDIIFSEKDEALVLPANQENEQMKMIAELNSDIHHIRQQTADGSNAEFNSGEENNKDIVNTDFTFNEVKDNSIENNTDTLAEKNGSPLSPVNREHEQNNVFAEVNKDIHIIQHQTTDGSNVEFSSGEEHNKNIVDKDCVFSAVEDSSILNNVNSLIPEHTENVGHDSQDENEACSSRGLLDNDGNGTKISFSTESYLQEREHSLSLPRTQENIEPKGTLTENHGELISPAKHENVLNEVTSELNKEMYHIRHESADGPNAESSIEEENKIHIVDKDYNFSEFDCSSIKNNGDAFAEKDGARISPPNREHEQNKAISEVNKDMHQIRQQTEDASNAELTYGEKNNKNIVDKDCNFNENEDSRIQNNADTFPEKNGARISPPNFEHEQANVMVDVNKGIHHIRQKTDDGSNVEFSSEEETNKTIVDKDCTFNEVDYSSIKNNADTFLEKNEDLTSPACPENGQKKVEAEVKKDINNIRRETTDGLNIELSSGEENIKNIVYKDCYTLAEKDGVLISPENHENEQKKVIAEVNKDMQTVDGSNVEFSSGAENNKAIVDGDSTFNNVKDNSIENNADTLPEKDGGLVSRRNHENEQNKVISEVNKDEYSMGRESNNNIVDKECTYSEIEGSSMQNSAITLPTKDRALLSSAEVISDVNKDTHHIRQNTTDVSNAEFNIGKENKKNIVDKDSTLNEVEDFSIQNNAVIFPEKNGALVSPASQENDQTKIIAELNRYIHHIPQQTADASNAEFSSGEENNKNKIDTDCTFNEVKDNSIPNNADILAEKDGAFISPGNNQREQKEVIGEVNKDIYHFRQQATDGSNVEFSIEEENIVDTDCTFNEVKENSIQNNAYTLSKKDATFISPVNHEHGQKEVIGEVHKDIYHIRQQTTDGSNAEFSNLEESNKNIVDTICTFKEVKVNSIQNNADTLSEKDRTSISPGNHEHEQKEVIGEVNKDIYHIRQQAIDGSNAEFSSGEENNKNIVDTDCTFNEVKDTSIQNNADTLSEKDRTSISPGNHEHEQKEVIGEVNKDIYHIRQQTTDCSNAEFSSGEQNNENIVDTDCTFKEVKDNSIQNNAHTLSEMDATFISPVNHEHEEKEVIGEVNKDIYHIQQQTTDCSNAEFSSGEENIVDTDCTFKDNSVQNNADTLSEKDGTFILHGNHEHEQKEVIGEVNKDIYHIREQTTDCSNAEFSSGEQNNENTVDTDCTIKEVKDNSIQNNAHTLSEKDGTCISPANHEHEEKEVIGEVNKDICHIRQQSKDGSNAKCSSGEEKNENIVNTDYTFKEVKDNSIQNNADTLSEKDGTCISPVNQEHVQKEVVGKANKDIYHIRQQTTDGSNAVFSSGEENNKNIVDTDCTFDKVKDNSIQNNADTLAEKDGTCISLVNHEHEQKEVIGEVNKDIYHIRQQTTDGSNAEFNSGEENNKNIVDADCTFKEVKYNSIPNNTDTPSEKAGTCISPVNQEHVLKEVIGEANKDMYHIRQQTKDGSNAECSSGEEKNENIVDTDCTFKEVKFNSIQNNADTLSEKDGTYISPVNQKHVQKEVIGEANKDIYHIRQQTADGSDAVFSSGEVNSKNVDDMNYTFIKVKDNSIHNNTDNLSEKDGTCISPVNREHEQKEVIGEVNKDKYQIRQQTTDGSNAELRSEEENKATIVDTDCTIKEVKDNSIQNNAHTLSEKDETFISPVNPEYEQKEVIGEVNKDIYHIRQQTTDYSNAEFSSGEENNENIVDTDCTFKEVKDKLIQNNADKHSEKDATCISPVNHEHEQKEVIGEVNKDIYHIRQQTTDGSNAEFSSGEENNENIVDTDCTFDKVKDNSIQNNAEKDGAFISPVNHEHERKEVIGEVNKDIYHIRQHPTDRLNVEFSSGKENNENIIDTNCTLKEVKDNLIPNNAGTLSEKDGTYMSPDNHEHEQKVVIGEVNIDIYHIRQQTTDCSNAEFSSGEENNKNVVDMNCTFIKAKDNSIQNIADILAEKDGTCISPVNQKHEQIGVIGEVNKDMHHMRQHTNSGSDVKFSSGEENNENIVDKNWTFNEVEDSSMQSNTDAFPEKHGALISPENHENAQKKMLSDVNKDIHHIRMQTADGSNVEFSSGEENNKDIVDKDCTFTEVEDSSQHNADSLIPEHTDKSNADEIDDDGKHESTCHIGNNSSDANIGNRNSLTYRSRYSKDGLLERFSDQLFAETHLRSFWKENQMNNDTRFGASEAKENEENLSKIQTVEEMRHEDSVFYEEKIEDTVKSVGEDVAVLELYTKVTSNDVLNELSFQSDIQVNYENENNSSENKSVPVKTDIDILSIAESPKIEVSNNTKYISINSVGEERIPRYFHGIPQTSLENNIAPKRKLYKDAMAFTIPFDNQKIITSKRSKPQSPSQKPDIEIDMDFIEVDSELEAESPTKLFEELIEIENNNIDAIDLDITQAIDDIIRIKCGINEDKVSSDEDSHFSSTPETSLHTIVELSEPDVAKTKEFVIIAQRTPDLNQLLTDKKCDGMRSNVNDHDKCVKNILPDVYEELIELAPIPPSNGSSLDKDDFEYHLIKEINKLEKTIKSDEEGLSISLEQKKGYSATIIQRAVRQFLNSRKTREHIYINHNHEYTESELAPISPDSSPSLDNDIEYHLTNEINNIKRTSKIDEEGLTIYLEQKERYSATIIQRAVREFLKSKKTRERNMNQNHEGIKDDSNIEVEFSTDKRNKATLIIQRAFRKYLLDTKKHTYSGVPTDSVIGAKYVTLNSKEKYDGIVDKSRAAIVIQNAFRNYLQRKPKCLVPKSSDHLLQHEFNPPVIGPKNVTLNSKENHDGRVDKSRAAIVIQNAFRNYLQRKPKCLVRKSNDHQLQHESNPPAQSHYLLNETQELLYSEDKVADYKGFTDPDQNEVNDCNDNRLSPINPEKGIHIPIFKTIDSHKENRRLTSLEASEEYAAIVIQNFFKAYFDKTPSKLKTLDKIDNPLNQGGNSNGKFVNAARTIQNAYRKYYNQKHDILERKPIDKSHNPNSSFDGGNNGHLFQKNSSTSLKDTKLRFNNAIIVIQKAFRKYRQQKFVALEGENYRKKSLEATRNSAAIILQKAFRRYKQQHCNSEFASKELDEKFIDYSKKNDTIEARELNSTHLHKHGMPTEEFDEHIKKSNWYVGDEPIVTSGLTEVKQAETPFEETVAYLEFGDNPPNLFGSENSTSLVTVDAIVSDITTNAPVFTSNNNGDINLGKMFNNSCEETISDTKKDEYVINELLPEPGNELLFEMPPDKPLNVEDKTIPNIVERKSEHNKKMIASFLESERAFSGRSSEYLWAKSPNTEEIAEIHRDFVQAERSCANRPGKIANGDPNSSETETDDSLKLKYEKLDGLDNSIAKMQQRKESTHKISSKFEYRKYTFEDSSVDSVIYFENNVDTDEEGIIVGKMESNDSRESSAQSDIILCEDGGENLNFENQNDSYNELSIRGLLKRVHTIATDSDIKNLMKSVTIDDSVRYIEPADDQLTSENFFLDDDTSENIRRKMMAYSLSEADSDCFDKSEVNNAIDDKTRTLDSFNVRTALIDNGDTSTETESTIVSAVTKIQAGARGYLARKRLGRTSDCKSTVILNESGASFGNAAISESLEYLLQETAAKRIQMFYRNYREKHGKFNTVHPPKRVSLSTTSAESSLAQKRSMLQRGDALRNNSTPDEGNSSSNDSENCVSVNARDVNQHSISKANISDAAKRAKHIENNKMKWIAMRQNSMPVQIDSEVFRVIPKHMRKKTKSAEIGKGHRKRPFCYD